MCKETVFCRKIFRVTTETWEFKFKVRVWRWSTVTGWDLGLPSTIESFFCLHTLTAKKTSLKLTIFLENLSIFQNFSTIYNILLHGPSWNSLYFLFVSLNLVCEHSCVTLLFVKILFKKLKQLTKISNSACTHPICILLFKL